MLCEVELRKECTLHLKKSYIGTEKHFWKIWQIYAGSISQRIHFRISKAQQITKCLLSVLHQTVPKFYTRTITLSI